jgi:membrane-bound serine protease (ClpP class)
LSTTAYLFLALGLIALLVSVSVISLWKHKQAGTGRVQLLGASAVFHTELEPEGTVLIQGELWRARSLDGTSIAAQQSVEVARVEGHLLLMKRPDES